MSDDVGFYDALSVSVRGAVGTRANLSDLLHVFQRKAS